MHDTDNPIEAVRARLDGGRKWHRYSLGDMDGDGAVCLMGAAMCVSAASEDLTWCDVLDPIAAVIGEQYPERRGRHEVGVHVPGFNDHEDTTWPEVDALLDKASVRWQEQVR